MADAADGGGDFAGWIYKQGTLVKTWKKRFAVLRGRQLTYYDTESIDETTRAKGLITVVAVTVSDTIPNGLALRGLRKRELKLYTDSAECTARWYQALLDAIDEDDDDDEPESSGDDDMRLEMMDDIRHSIQNREEEEEEEEAAWADGFLATESMSGATSIWNNLSSHVKRLSLDDVKHDSLIETTECSELWRGRVGSTSVVIKRLSTANQSTENALFVASNVKKLARLRHPLIVGVVGAVWTKAIDIQVVQDFVAGGDLHTFLSSTEASALSWTDTKGQLAIDVVCALQYLHKTASEASFDLTSRKVLVSTDGRARVNPLQFSSGLAASKLRWSAPELILGGSESSRSGVYSLGVLLCELDTLQLPYHDAMNANSTVMEDAKIAMLVAKGELKPSLSGECPDEIAQLAGQCLSFDPEQRPSIDSVSYKLREFLKNEMFSGSINPDNEEDSDSDSDWI